MERRLHGLPRHAGRSRFVKGTNGIHEVAEFGIACEACHSQGHEHIARNRDPLRRFKIHLTSKTDSTITNPSKLKGPASALACGQCHSVWAFNDMEDKIDFNRHGAGFRPGTNDLVQRFVVQPNSNRSHSAKRFHSQDRTGFFPEPLLGRWHDSRDRPRV